MAFRFIAWALDSDGNRSIHDIMEPREGSEHFAYKMAMRYVRTGAAQLIEAEWGSHDIPYKERKRRVICSAP